MLILAYLFHSPIKAGQSVNKDKDQRAIRVFTSRHGSHEDCL
jgi:hypothetical protein